MAAVKDWPGLLQKVFTNLSPGGTVEVFEGFMEMKAEDGSTAANSAAIYWFELAQEYLGNHGIAWDLARKIPQQMTGAGFELVEDKAITMRLYPDSQDPETDRNWVATQYCNDMADMVHGMTGRMRTDLASRLSPGEWDVLEKNARHELLEEAEQRGFHTTL